MRDLELQFSTYLVKGYYNFAKDRWEIHLSKNGETDIIVFDDGRKYLNEILTFMKTVKEGNVRYFAIEDIENEYESHN